MFSFCTSIRICLFPVIAEQYFMTELGNKSSNVHALNATSNDLEVRTKGRITTDTYEVLTTTSRASGRQGPARTSDLRFRQPLTKKLATPADD